MDVNLLIAIASLVSSLGVAAAAIVAAFTLREQRTAQRRQMDLENLRWLAQEWNALRSTREAAALSLINGKPSLSQIREVLNFLETVGYLVRRHLIEDETLGRAVGEIPVRGWRHWTADFIRQQREQLQGATFWLDIEWLDQHLAAQLPDGPWLNVFLQRESGETASPNSRDR